MIDSIVLPWRFGTIEVAAADLYIRAAIELTGEYCGDELDLYQALLRPGDVAVDVGANIGVFTVGMALAVGATGRVLAFEPQPPVFAMLQRNVAAHGLSQVDAHRTIVAGRDGIGRFVDLREVPRDQRLNLGALSTGSRIRSGFGEMVSTPVHTLDSFQLGRCELIKVDVEGGESGVLAGAAGTLRRCRPILSLECDRPNAASPWADDLLAADYQLWRFRAPLVRTPNPNEANIAGMDNPLAIMVIAVPIERVDVLDKVNRSTLQPVPSRAALEAYSRRIVRT